MRRTAISLCAIALLGACADDDGEQPSTVNVFAASSLSDVLVRFGDFQNDGRSVEVEFNLAGSSALREQILDGADADVFISANESVMQEIIDEGLTDFEPVQIAANSLTIAVPVGNPAGVTGLSDFADDSLTLGLCAVEVPCGKLASDVLAMEGVETSVDTREPNVRALLSKVELGELDAALVYRTDVLASEDAEDVGLAAGTRGRTTYFAVQLSAKDEARQFIDLLLSPSSQEWFAQSGFEAA